MRHVPNSFASLFSGCGGFDLGFKQAGFLADAAFDHDREAVENYRANIHADAFQADLTRGIPCEDRLKGVPTLIAGPPCQGFSTAGRRMLNDCRNHLLPLTGRLALRLKPKVIVVENVPGALAGEHKFYWYQLNDMLREGGYKTHSFTCQAATLGMAQQRRREILIAWLSCSDPRFPVPNAAPATLKSILAEVDGLPNHSPQFLESGSVIARIAQHMRQGQKLSNVRGGDRAVHTWDMPDVFGYTTRAERTVLELLLRLRRRNRQRQNGDADPVSPERLAEALGSPYLKLVKSLERKGYIRRSPSSFELVHTFNGKYRRLRWDRPSCTVDTRFGQPRYFLHPEQQRGFTVREAARIQGFPDTYVFAGSATAQYRLIGNAVPPPIGKLIGNYVAHLLALRC